MVFKLSDTQFKVMSEELGRLDQLNEERLSKDDRL